MKKQERLLIIINESSGKRSKASAISGLYKILKPHFHTLAFINSSSPGEGKLIASHALPFFDVICAFGGDGTINSIASSLLGTKKILGILPGGSGNGMIRNLKIPLSWQRATETLINGKDSMIDACRINDKIFFNVAGIGLDGLISKRFNLESGSRGIGPYVYHALKEYLQFIPIQIEIESNHQILNENVMLLAVANFQQYGGKAIIAPFADPADDLLDVCIINQFKLSRVSYNVNKLFSGKINDFPFYKTFKTKKVVIKSLSGKIPFHFDGEYGGDDYDCFTCEVLPAKINIRIPIL